jgi:hypothetical protein
MSPGISDAIPRRFLLQTCSNTVTITSHHFPTLSQEHLNLSLRSNLALLSLHTYELYPRPY